MLDWITAITSYFNDWLQFQIEFVQQLAVELVAWFVIVTSIAAIEASIKTLDFAYAVTLEIIEQMQFNQTLNSYFSLLPTDVQGGLVMMSFPAAINLILTALVLKFVLGKLGAI